MIFCCDTGDNCNNEDGAPYIGAGASAVKVLTLVPVALVAVHLFLH